ncbi:hypothetical protein ACVWXM_002495 [Bradyrhizobium sp. GM7.3]
MLSTPHATLAVTDTHKSALRRALRVTASEKWDLNRRFPLVMSRASGAHVWDVDGRRYVDLTSCSGAAPLGAGYEPVVDHVVSELRRTGGTLPGAIVRAPDRAGRTARGDIPTSATLVIFSHRLLRYDRRNPPSSRAHGYESGSYQRGYHGWHDWQLQDRPAMGLPRPGPGQCRLPLRSRPIRESFR